MLFSSSDCGRGAHVLRVRSAPRPRLSRLLPFALWQDTSLQAKKQCSRRTTKHNFGCAFSLSGCGQGAHVPFCTFRSLSSPSSTCAPCSAFGQRLARDNNSATHARLSRFSTLALRPIISLFQTRSAPRPRLSRLLPFALWQDTSLQAKKQCPRRTTKHNFGCAFFFVRPWARCSRTFVRSAPRPRLPRLVRLAPRLVNVWQEITTPLRMLAFRDFQRLLCARLFLCFKNAPRLVLVFLGSCRLLFGKAPLCKQKSSVQDVQQKHGDLPCVLI